ncbi:MAG TPA: hypothetical protein VKE74_29090 [Gemmataceae bacterium]|nr:hypothetical protein [Gemmataceae bacterium]
MELEPASAGQVAALKVLVEKFRHHEESTLRMVEQGAVPPQTAVRARIARLEVEIKLAHATAAARNTSAPPAAPAVVVPVCSPRRLLWRR